jgi:hypothetical protein
MENHPLSRIFATTFALLGLTAHADAATLLGLPLSSGSYQWPTSTILAGNEQTTATVTTSSGNDLKENRDQGQTFTITQNGTIDLIAINFEGFSSSGNAAFTFNFFQVVSATNPTMVGSVIDSLTVGAANITALGFANGAQGTLVFDVANTAVTVGSTYAIQFDTNLADTNPVIKWRRDNAGSYSGGQSFGTAAAPDYHFGVYNIPEPSSALLGGLGLLALLRRRR